MNVRSYIHTMDPNDINQIIKTTSAFRLLGDPTRFRILCFLLKEKEGMCVYEIADSVDISHSAASHQLAKLEAHNIVECYREGQSACYALKDNEFTRNLIRVMQSFRPSSAIRRVLGHR